MGRRQADKAGTWYPGDAGALAAQVNELVDNDPGARTVPGARPRALMLPHAGIAYSGGVAAAGFRLLRDAGVAVDTFVVFGACHRAFLVQPAVWAAGCWDTPLGPLAIDEELAERFVRDGVGTVNETPHLGDNAIELQTPFIKALFPEAKIVPIAVSPLTDAARRGRLAALAARDLGRRAFALASTDLTHYGAAFNLLPAGTGQPALDWLRANDERFLRAVQSLDGERLIAVAERDGSACGSGAVAAAVGWAVEEGASRARVLAYATSHDVMPTEEAEHIVGYGSVVFE